MASRRGGPRAHKFFATRRPVGALTFDSGEGPDLKDYVNVSPRIGFLISHEKTLIGPLSTTFGLEDMYDLLEVVQIDAHNDTIMRREEKRARERGE